MTTQPATSGEQLERKRKAAIIRYLRGERENPGKGDVECSAHDDCTFEFCNAEYRVLTDSEADAAYAEAVKDSAWAFRSGFLASATGLESSDFAGIQDKCESANPAILAMIKGSCGFDEFIRLAEEADGRGHILSSYDGEENEFGDFYIYRVN